MVSRKVSITLVGVVVALMILSSTAAATVVVETESDYSGGEEDESQAVDITYTISPQESEITDVRIDVSRTGSSFVDHSSYERSVNPGRSELEIQSVGEGIFNIDSLQPDEELTLRFEAYPRDIQTTSLDVATVSIEYVQRGQNLSNQTTISADLSTSPWFKYRNAQDGDGGGGGGGVLAFIFGLLIGGTGIGIGLYKKYNKSEF